MFDLRLIVPAILMVRLPIRLLIIFLLMILISLWLRRMVCHSFHWLLVVVNNWCWLLMLSFDLLRTPSLAVGKFCWVSSQVHLLRSLRSSYSRLYLLSQTQAPPSEKRPPRPALGVMCLFFWLRQVQARCLLLATFAWLKPTPSRNGLERKGPIINPAWLCFRVGWHHLFYYASFSDLICYGRKKHRLF